jgi:hypothetical protein
MEKADIGAPRVFKLAVYPNKSNVCVCPKRREGQHMQDKTIPESVSAIFRKLALLPSLPSKELKKRWRLLYSSEPPLRVSRELLIRAVAYRIREQALGGLKPSTRRLLERLARDARVGKPLTLSSCAPPVSAGTVLMRDWQGVTHEVQVLDRGVLYKRKRYRSLSEVARLITGSHGSHWSGPLFFACTARERGRRAVAEGDKARCLRQAAFFPRTLLRKMSAGSQMDMPKSRTENFRRFSRSAAAVGILRVHGRA